MANGGVDVRGLRRPGGAIWRGEGCMWVEVRSGNACCCRRYARYQRRYAFCRCRYVSLGLVTVAFATPAWWSIVVVVPNQRTAWLVGEYVSIVVDSGPSWPMVGVVFGVSSSLLWAAVGSVMGLEVNGVGVRRQGKDENEP